MSLLLFIVGDWRRISRWLGFLVSPSFGICVVRSTRDVWRSGGKGNSIINALFHFHHTTPLPILPSPSSSSSPPPRAITVRRPQRACVHARASGTPVTPRCTPLHVMPPNLELSYELYNTRNIAKPQAGSVYFISVPMPVSRPHYLRSMHAC